LREVEGGARVWGGRARSDKDEDEDIGLRSVCMDSLNVKQVASGWDHAALITTSNSLYVWGDNTRFALGFDTRGVAETRPGYLAASINVVNNAGSSGAAASSAGCAASAL